MRTLSRGWPKAGDPRFRRDLDRAPGLPSSPAVSQFDLPFRPDLKRLLRRLRIDDVRRVARCRLVMALGIEKAAGLAVPERGIETALADEVGVLAHLHDL